MKKNSAKRTFSLPSFALGNIWRWTTSKNRNVLVNYAKKLDISGIEITFATKEELYSFKLSNANKSWLRQLDYVSIHAPFRLVRKAKDEKEIIKQLNIISKLYNDVKAKNVIIHPNDLPKPKILKKYKFNVSIENLPKKRRVTIPKLKRIFGKYPKIKLCLDVSHAYRWSKFETGKLVQAFKRKISQIHFSGTYRNREHQSLRKVTKTFLHSIQSIKKLNVPIIVEEDIKIKNLRCIKEEIEYIKKFLNSNISKK